MSGAEVRELRYDERMRRVIALSIVFGVGSMSCAAEEQAGVCGGESAIQVWSGSGWFPFLFGPKALGERPVVHISTGTPEMPKFETLVVEPCGAGGVVVDVAVGRGERARSGIDGSHADGAITPIDVDRVRVEYARIVDAT